MSTRTTVGTSVSRVIPDEHLPNSVRDGLLRALFEDGEIADYVQEAMISSLGVRAEQMYDYAERPVGGYVFGSPTGEFDSGNTSAPAVREVLGILEGVPVTLDYVHYSRQNFLHIGWMRLVQDYGYSPLTNELTTLSAAKHNPVYLEDMVIVIDPTEILSIPRVSLDQWGFAARAGLTPERTGSEELRATYLPTQVDKVPGATKHLRVSYMWEIGVGGTVMRESIDLAITGYDPTKNYYHVKYLTVPGVPPKYWLYEDNLGTYPTLDVLNNTPSIPNGSFFPLAYFRYDGISEIDDKGTPEYKSSKKLVKYLGMDYNDIAEAIDDNPDIGGVEQAMMLMAVPANPTEPIEQRYLFDFFESVYNTAEYNGNRYGSTKQEELSGIFYAHMPLKPNILIQDSRFELSIEFSGFYKHQVNGSIGPIGTHTTLTSDGFYEYEVIDPDTSLPVTMADPIVYHHFRRQLTAGIYEEIKITGLRTVYWVLGEFRQTIGEDDDPILLIPLDRAITENYSSADRELLYSRSLHYVFNSVLVTNVAWYQTSIFQFVVTAVAVFITAWSLGTTGPMLSGLIAAGAYSAAATIVLTSLLRYVAFYIAFQLFVKVVGVRVALVVAIVAALLGITNAIQAGGLNAAPWATDLLTLSSGLSNQVSSVISTDMQALLAEARGFESYKVEQIELLESAQKLLENTSPLSPFVIFGESPKDYYNRTVHSGNIGVVGIEAVSSYVSVQLRLPDLNDSIGDTIYE